MPRHVKRALILIVLLGAALRLASIGFGLPYLQARPDERVAIRKALDALDGRPNPHFFHWPSLTFYTFAGVLQVAQGIRGLVADSNALTFSEQHLIARSVVALAGTATLLVLFRVGRRVADDAVGLVASLLLAVALLHVRDSHFAMTDVLMTLLLWLSLLALCDAAAGRDRGAATCCALAGLLGGLAASTKYNAAAGAAGMAAVQVLLFARQPRTLWSWRGWLPSLAFGAAAVFGFIAGTPYSIFDSGKFREDLAYDFTHLSQGHEGLILGRGWTYHLTHSLSYGVGLPVFVAAVAGLVPLLWRRPIAWVLVAFAAAFYASIGSGYTVFFRYVMPLVPFVCLSAAAAVTALARWISTHSRVKPAIAFAAILALTAGPAAVKSVRLDLLLARTDTRVLATSWLEPRIRPGESLHDAGGHYAQLDLWRVKYDRWDYDAFGNVFSAGPGRLPDWLVLDQSPLSAYTPRVPALWQLARRSYRLVVMFRGAPEQSDAVYDLQDAFFVPISGFSTLERPGPTIYIYRRGDLPFDGLDAIGQESVR
jgi:4-amino-4-deoxy-L-arabinose transferase-like glycosyltransferase